MAPPGNDEQGLNYGPQKPPVILDEEQYKLCAIYLVIRVEWAECSVNWCKQVTKLRIPRTVFNDGISTSCTAGRPTSAD